MSAEAESQDMPISTPINDGMVCDTKEIYEVKKDRFGQITWSAKYPDDVEDAAENAETARCAILLRYRKSFDSRKKMEMDSIIIQSPLLKQVLNKVMKDYPGVTTSLQRLEFKSPFNPFVHRWIQLLQAIENENDEDTKAHLVLLQKILEPELKDVIEARIDYIENKVVTYDHLWTIFQPGCILYKPIWGRDSAVSFSHGVAINDEKKGHVYRVYCYMVNWDGEKFGFDLGHCDISEFIGTAEIDTLPVFPLEFHPDEKKIKAKLFKRGKLFEQYRGHHFRYYKSFAIGEDTECGCPIKVTVDSRIIIDTRAYGKFNPNKVSPLKALNHKRASEIVDLESDYGSDEYELYEDDINYSPRNPTLNRDKDSTWPTIKPLASEHLIICSPLLKGYALKEKLWLEFLVDVPTDIAWSNSAFQSLVLPPAQKELIHAIATSQISNSSKFDDVISGKGKGIIFLLSGGPGIGKTLTAESVAEQMQVPLYVLSAGDLGTESKDVESALRSVLQMVTSWNAILLLDECDVFLEARTSNSLERNKIVSIFLRTLEYYEGILFMTTNRVNNIDPAFKSRIHLSMDFKDLDKNAREKIWRNFLSRGEDQGHHHQITDVEIGRLADSNINGRQIKNVLKTAKLLASHKGELLKFEHVGTVMSVEGN
ncbi:hypothetical protein BELL_0129g00190 [Botrytis elliptica]|uniref:AAA+ ATPase domain-containing protein n=1 Tax=Botrytis elliptica TaxID=278938 RepID=A0A4Z1K6L5_9HELO|nr:hypothetical protein EAE99_003206 [Botrytis elliptica]TGO76973.1 hypothetical protein BELL_0129g00190 [Botrytis elliptica]